MKLGKGNFQRLVRAAAATVMALAMVGCSVGNEFVQPKPGAFQLLKTTRSEVYQKMGSHPYASGSALRDGKMIDSLTYAYGNAGADGTKTDVAAVRGETFYFLGPTLVGMEYVSSFKVDATTFDESKVAQIKKGTSTKADVINLLGPATGLYAPPLIPATSYRGLVYQYAQLHGLSDYSYKILIIGYDKSGVVTDIKYTAVSKN